MADEERSTPVTIAPPFANRDQVGPRAAADVEDALAAIGVEVDQPRKMVQLLEVVLIEIREELPGPWDVDADVEIVDVTVPVVSDLAVVGM